MEPTITSKNLPPIQQPTAIPPGAKSVPASPVVDKQIPYEQIIAKPLRTPNFFNLKPKNPNMSLYWGNRAVGERESTMRYDQLIAMGFRPARPEEVLDMSGSPCPPSMCKDGRIMTQDVILLIIPRADYVGSLKWNEQSARLRVRKPGTVIPGGATEHQTVDGREAPVDAFREIAANPNLAKKVQAFVPDLAKVDALTKD